MIKPILLSSLKTYNKGTLLADLFAGLTVGVVALPLAMAFSIACGLGPEKGLITAVVAGFLISLFSGSRFQIGGPTGAFVIIISGVLTKFGFDGLVICTLLAGVLLVVMGLCRMGALIRFIPFPVVTGFTSGIAVVIFSTQIKDMLGLSIHGDIPAGFVQKWGCYFNNISTVNWTALCLCAGTIATILLCRKLNSKLPAMLIGMLAMTVVSAAISAAFGLRVETIGDRFAQLPNSLPLPSLPAFGWAHLNDLIMPAFTIALLAAIESLLSASVADGMTSTRHKPNAELVAQGIGNIGSALFMGIPATGAIARTATNVKAGGKTPVSGMIHAVTVLLILVLFAQYAKLIPFCVLAGILAIVCYNMSEMRTFARLLRSPRSDAAVLLITFFLTVFVDLIVAVEVGVVLASLLFIGRMAQTSQISAVKDALNDEGDSSRSTEHKEIPSGVEIFDIQGPFFFGAVDGFKEFVFRTLESDVHIVILRMRLVPVLDATGLQVLEDFCKQCHHRDIKLLLCGVQPAPLEVIRHADLYRAIKKPNICVDIDAALARARRIIAKEEADRKRNER